MERAFEVKLIKPTPAPPPSGDGGNAFSESVFYGENLIVMPGKLQALLTHTFYSNIIIN